MTIQVYTAFISFCMLAICMLAMAADNLKYEGTLYEFANIMSVSLTERTYLQDLIVRYNNIADEPQKSQELFLFDFDKM